MIRYAALLRGIGPSNPNMRNDKLRGVLENLGFRNVRTVISSGNVLFESSERDAGVLEERIERAWPKQLGFTSTTIIRSRAELQALADANPFRGLEHSRQTYLVTTFLKRPPRSLSGILGNDAGFNVVRASGREVCAVLDTTEAGTPDYMAWLEKRLGKEITTRTWKTVERILGKLDED